MKKIFMLFTAFALVTALSACDLISPQTVEEISEEYCRDNPDSEICQGESVGTLDEDTVINVFNIILEDYNDDSQSSFCEDYFSVTNTTLLDECRASRTGLFPEDVSDYSIESVTQKTALSTLDVFELVVLSPTKTKQYTFEIGLTMIDGIMYIDDWSFTEETLDPTALEVPLEEAQAHFEQYLLDYVNDNITSTTICDVYLSQLDTLDCTSQREDDLANGIAATTNSFEPDGEGYKAIVNLDFNSETETVELLLTFVYDETGAIVMTISMVEDEVPNEYTMDDYRLFLDDLFNDFFFSTRAPEDICNDYFIPDQYDFCMEGYENKETEGYIQELGAFFVYDDHYKIVVSTYLDEVFQAEMTIEVWFFENDDGLKVEFLPQDYEQTEFEVYHQHLIDFFNAYNNPDVPDADAIGGYVDPEQVQDMIDSRAELFANQETIELLDFYWLEDEQAWFIKVNVVDDSGMDEKEVEVAFFKDNDNLYVTFIDDSGYEENVFYLHMVAFIDAYNNPNLSDNEAVDPYVDAAQAPDIKDSRQEALESGFSINLIDFYFDYDLESYVVVLELFEDDGTPVLQTSVVYFTYDLNGDLKVYFDDQQQQDYAEYYQHVESFLEAYFNPNISDDDAVDPFIDPEQVNEIKADRADILTNGYVMYLVNLYFDEQNGTWYIELEVHEEGDVYNETEPVEFYYDQNNTLKMHFDDTNEPYPGYDAWEELADYLDWFTDDTVPSEELCNRWFEYEEYDRCMERRMNFDSEYDADLISVEPFGPDQYRVVINYYRNDNDMYTEDVTVHFYFNQNGEIKLDWIPYPEDYETFRVYLQAYINEFSDTSIPDDEFCRRYFETDQFDKCIDRRGNHNQMEMIFLDQLLPLGGNDFELILRYSDGTSDWFESITVQFYNVGTPDMKMEFHYPDPYPHDDVWVLFDEFMRVLITDDVTDDEFCAMFFHDATDSVCYELRNELRYSEDIYYSDFYTNDGQFYYARIHYIVEGTPVEVEWKLEFFYNDNNELKLVLHGITTPIDWDSAQLFLDQFVADFNNRDITDDTLAFNYAKEQSYNIIVDLREQYLNRNITYYWLYEEYGNYTIELEFVDGTRERFDVAYFDVNGVWLAEWYPTEPYYEITDDQIYNLAYDITQQFNEGWDIDTICMAFFDPASFARCLMELDQFNEQNVYLQLESVWMDADYWHINLQSYDPDEIYSEYTWDVFAYINQDEELVFDFLDHSEIPVEDMETHLFNFIAMVNDPNSSFEIVCNQYINPDHFQTCYELFVNIPEGNFGYNIVEYDLSMRSNYVELELYDFDNDVALYHIQLDVEFLYYNDNNDIHMSIWNLISFRNVSDLELETFVNNLFAMLNDTTVPDDAFCEEYGMLFQDCYQIRTLVQSGEIVTVTDWERTTDRDVQINAVRSDNGNDMEHYIIFLHITWDVNHGYMYDGWQDSFIPQFPLEVIQDEFNSLILTYFDSTYTDDDLLQMYGNDMYLPGLRYREDLLSMNYTVEVGEVRRVFQDYGYEQFEGDILVTLGDVTTIYTIMLDVYMDDNSNPILNLFYPYDWPTNDELNNLYIQFTTDFNDPTIPHDVFCETYFDPYDQDVCLYLRNEEQGQLTYLEESDPMMPDIGLFNFVGSTLEPVELRFGVHLDFDILGSHFLYVHPEQDNIVMEYAYQYMDWIISELNSGSITPVDFCTMYGCGDIWTPDPEAVINQVYYEYIFHDWLGTTLESSIQITYMDGTYETLLVEIPYTLNVDGEYQYGLIIVGRDAPIPTDAFVLELPETAAVFEAFMLDIIDPDITNLELCNLYFGGIMSDPSCVEGRDELVSLQTTITYTPIVEVVDIYGDVVYTTTITLDDGTDIESMDVVLHIYLLSDGSHYILFFDNDYYDDVEPV